MGHLACVERICNFLRFTFFLTVSLLQYPLGLLNPLSGFVKQGGHFGQAPTLGNPRHAGVLAGFDLQLAGFVGLHFACLHEEDVRTTGLHGELFFDTGFE